MEVPKTYIATNSEGQQVCVAKAQDANNLINPDEVKKALDKIEKVAEEGMKNIISAMTDITYDAEEAIIVEGTKMTETIENVCKELKQVPDTLMGSISSIYQEAVRAHDELQIKANNEAKTTAAQAASAAGGSVIEG